MADTFRKEYKPLTEEQVALVGEIKDQAQRLHDLIGTAESVGTAGDMVNIAKMRLEEAIMWAVKAATS